MKKVFLIRRKHSQLRRLSPFTDEDFGKELLRLSSLPHDVSDYIEVYVSSRKKACWWLSRYSDNYSRHEYSLSVDKCPVLVGTEYFMDVSYYYIDSVEVL